MSEELGKRLRACRVVDLSKKVEPGKAEGPLGMGSRKYELKRFTFPPGELMHEVEMETHISTHVESPAHFMEPRHGRAGPDVAMVAINCFDLGHGRFSGIRTLNNHISSDAVRPTSL